MTEESTITSVSLGRGAELAVPGARDYLTVLVMCDQPTQPSSRHLIDHIDEVRFGRGERDAVRKLADGKRVLELRIPDPRMSSDHGRLFRGASGWVLDDPASKNGSIVDGELTRRATLPYHTVFELGRTFLWLANGTPADPARPDVLGHELAPPHPTFATFLDPLASGFAALARIAATDVSVVLLGETGTGKEVVARALHELSGRAGPFVPVNCGGLPTNLVENELFGHRKGAFSGATADRTGLVRTADSGTLFLDEVGELPPPSQTVFLRVLQEREVVPIGADRAVPVDLRVCAATLRDLEDMVEAGSFRRDLYARLFGYTFELPPLRARRADLGLLINVLVARQPNSDQIQILPAAMRALVRHDWPLNIRELEKVLISAIALAPERVVDVGHLPEAMRRPSAPAAPADEPEVDRALRGQLIGLLQEHAGNVVAVAERMGKRRMQIYRWVKKLDIDLAAFRK